MTDFRPISKTRPPDQRGRDIFHLVVVEGFSSEDVAKKYKIKRRQVERIVFDASRWQTLQQASVDPKMTQVTHLQMLRHQYEQIMLAWRSSRTDDVIVKATHNGQGELQKKEHTVRPQSGELRYLEHARRIMAEIRELEAILSPPEKEQELPDVENLTEEEYDQILAELDCRLAELVQRAGMETDSPVSPDLDQTPES